MKRLLLSAIGCLIFAGICAQESAVRTVNTIAVSPDDTPAMIVEKAIRVVPTPNQLSALENEFIAFIHFGPNTFTRREWGTGFEKPEVFDLRTLDTDQWCEAMKAAGMKMVIVTAKHHDGFVIWQSRYTDHGIMSSPFQDGQGDIVRDLARSCAKYGLKMGIYLSPADLYQIENPQGLYGNLSPYTRRTIPREVPGRPFANKTTFEFEVDDYNEYFLNQLFELLTEYGPIYEVWFDGAHPKRKGGQKYNYPAWRELIRTLAPEAVIFGREDVRWCGNEAGATRDTEWNVVAYDQNPDTATVFHDMTDYDLGSIEALSKARFMHYQQAETNTSIREGWFYRDDSTQQVRSADDVFDMYERAVGGNSTLLLNIPPNREGRFSPRDAEVLHEVGRRIRETYATNLFAGADTTGSTPGEIYLSFARPVTVNRIALGEDIAHTGERVENFAVDAFTDGQWHQIATATNIGYKRIVRFPDVTASQFRIRITGTRALPHLSTITGHYYRARAPRLQAAVDRSGMVTLSPMTETFGWNAYGNNAAANLSSGASIYYTTDGSEPDVFSTPYTAPFQSDGGTVRAIAVLHGEAGPVLTERIGIPKDTWSASLPQTAASADAAAELAKAFDADPSTVWTAAAAELPVIEFDLGLTRTLSGLSYTPPTRRGAGMISEGRVQYSTDGKKWLDAGTFEFGNLVNDPTRRFFTFPAPVNARYVRIEPRAKVSADADRPISIAEIDFL